MENTSRTRAWTATGLFLSTVLVFIPALANGFVEVDDGTYVWRNPDVLRGLHWATFRWALTTPDFPTWHPLTVLSHLTDVTLYGVHPWGHHLTSVLLHALTAVLVFLAFAEATGRLARSAFVAALFAVHPLRVESVAWVAERKDVLCGLFCAAAVLLYVRYRQQPSLARAAGVTITLGAALAAKPMAVTLPFVFLLLDVWPLGKGEGWRWRILEKTPWVALVGGVAAATVSFQRHAGAVQVLLPLRERLATVPLAYAKALGLTLWPAELSFQYLRRTPTAGQVLGATAVLVALSLLAWAVRRERPSLWVGFAWLAGMMVPTVGLIQVGAQLTADRYTYFPHVGLFAGVVFALPALSSRLQRRWAVLGAGLLWSACAERSLARTADWRSSDSLFDSALAVDPANDWVLVSRGILRFHEQRPLDARADFQRALALRPGNSFAMSALALASLEAQQPAEALALARNGAQLAPGDFAARLVLGRVLLALGQPAAAVGELQAARALNPADIDIRRSLVSALGAAGQNGAALTEVEAALTRWPEDPDLLFNRAIALARLGRLPEARTTLEVLLRDAPGYPGAATALERVREDLQATQRH